MCSTTRVGSQEATRKTGFGVTRELIRSQGATRESLGAWEPCDS